MPGGHHHYQYGPSYEGPSSNGYATNQRHHHHHRHHSAGHPQQHRRPPPPPSSGAGPQPYYYQTRPGPPSAQGNIAPPPPPSAGAVHQYPSYSSSAAPSPSLNNMPTAGYRQQPEYNGTMLPPDSEHLATFAVGKQFGLQWPSDGIRKLKQMEKNSAIWAQPMILRLRPHTVSVEDENGVSLWISNFVTYRLQDIVEQFPMDLVTEPTAHLSNDPRDVYNNILLFIVKEDRRGGRTNTPTEMHIFQCNRISANEVVTDMRAFLNGQSQRIRGGRRDTGLGNGNAQPIYNGFSSNAAYRGSGTAALPNRDDASMISDSSEYFERDVNTLNRCFDDIERFVARIQSSALAQRELEVQAHRYRTAQRSRRQPDPQHGILQLRSQLPHEPEFVDILQKFKLSFNLLAKLKNHIHEPNAPELLHFLFTPLTVILDACHWGLGRNIAPQVVGPLLSREARELMQNCLTSKESDVWMALGEAWRVPPEDWPGNLPMPYRPVFIDGFAPYGFPGQYDTRPPPPPPTGHAMHRGVSAPPPQTAAGLQNAHRDRQSVDNLNIDLDRMTLEKDRLNFEREKMLERERRLADDEHRIRTEKHRLDAERRMLHEEQERRSISSQNPPYRDSAQASPLPQRRTVPIMQNGGILPGTPLIGTEQSPRQKAFVDDMLARRCKIVQATYDRTAQNPKELTVTRGEYLEVMNDQKNWWECKNVHSRVGYVPHTILSVVPVDRGDGSPQSLPPQDPLFVSAQDRAAQNAPQINPPAMQPGPALSPRPGMMMPDDTPEYIKQRQGKRGEFRYF